MTAYKNFGVLTIEVKEGYSLVVVLDLIFSKVAFVQSSFFSLEDIRKKIDEYLNSPETKPKSKYLRENGKLIRRNHIAETSLDYVSKNQIILTFSDDEIVQGFNLHLEILEKKRLEEGLYKKKIKEFRWMA